MESCKQCGFKFSLLSQRFYCCNSSESVCSVCHRKPCKKCQKPRTNEIIIPKCSQCSSRLYDIDLLFEYNCERYFCSKCLSGIFKDAYDKVTLQKIYDADTQVFVKFSCGHEYPYEELVGFFQHFCICCGAQYDSGLDYQFIDGVKLCFMCYRYFSKTYQTLLIKCEICQSIIKNSSKASILQSADVAICQKCTFESQNQQKMISKIRMAQLQQSPGIIKKDPFLNKSPLQEKQKQQLYNKSQTIQQQQELTTQKSPSSTKNKILKKQSISELKKKQSKRTSSNNHKPTTSFPVTNKFSNNFQELDQQTAQSLGLGQNIKLKRHLSNQTFVEQFKIEVGNMEGDFVRCRRCNVKVLCGEGYDLYAGLQKKVMNFDGKKSLVDFSTVKTSTSLLTQQQSTYFICRVCYSRSAQRQKSFLSSSISSKSKLQPSTTQSRPSKLEEPTIDKTDYLKVGQSSRVFNRSPSPSPTDKQYSLTGSRVNLAGSRCSINNQMKQSLLNSVAQQKKQPIIQKQYTKPLIHPVSGQSRATMSNNPPRFMKCDACRDIKKSLIATSTQGYLCDDCYYFKNPTTQSFFNTGRKW